MKDQILKFWCCKSFKLKLATCSDLADSVTIQQTHVTCLKLTGVVSKPKKVDGREESSTTINVANVG